MAVQAFVGPWPLFQFLYLYTVGRTPWTGDQPLPTRRTVQTQNKRTQYTSRVRFEPTIPELERAKTVHALDRTATVIGHHQHYHCLFHLRSMLVCTNIFNETVNTEVTSVNTDFRHSRWRRPCDCTLTNRVAQLNIDRMYAEVHLESRRICLYYRMCVRYQMAIPDVSVCWWRKFRFIVSPERTVSTVSTVSTVLLFVQWRPDMRLETREERCAWEL
jgi:hypothetical protein